ncbi:MAG: hydantoinase B/oxoprolinase family protein [Actinobacteria bacterium]|nr:hydantoinase B/oxoprolinase family protein [Actinomycetota bacterium]
MAPDSLTVAIIWGKLTAIAEEMATALSHTAYSDQVREGGDFSTALFNARGELIAQADRSPAHLGSMPSSVTNMLQYYDAEDLAPGDVVVLNDPHLGAGHLPDVFALSPVHVGETIVGYVCATIHVTDIGGMLAGSQAVAGVTESIQEGLRLLPTRLFSADGPNQEVLRIIAANVRVPDQVLGDIRAQRSALYVGAKKLAEVYERYGAETVDAVADSFLDSSERAVRELIEKMPDGSYNFVDHLDDTGPGSDPVRMEVTVTISGSEIHFDFTGTGPQTQSGLNSTLSYTRSYCYWVTKAITTRETIPQNSGQLRPVSISAPDACFLNAKEPIAVGGRACLNQRIVELLFGALAQAVPELVHAASGQWVNPIFAGTHASGEPFILYDFIIGGVGGRAHRDGVDAMSPVFSCENVPIEIQEAQYPILVERFEFITDSGGAGEQRGGLSLRKDIRMLTEGIKLSNLTDRQRFAPYGLHGGEDGKLGETVLISGSGGEEKLESKGAFTFEEGDVVSFRCAGSGGFGDPRQRSREAVRHDLEDGLISEQKARDVYALDD